jgi:hypothetical protein
MALTPVPSINLESLPQEAISLIETLAQRAQEADRLEQENRLLREMLRLERLKKYGVGGRIKVHHSGSNQNAPLWTAVF